MSTEVWTPPPDPDFDLMAREALAAFDVDAPRLVAFDTETSGVEFHDLPFCVTFAWRTQDGAMESHYVELGTTYRNDVARTILTQADELVGHNIKFDLQKVLYVGLLAREEVHPSKIHDTECLAHLDDEHREKGLKKLAITVLNEEDVIEVEVKSGPNKGQKRYVPREKHEMDAVRRKLKRKKEDGFHVIPRSIVVPYAIKDAELTLRLYERLKPNITNNPDTLARLYEQEMKLTTVFLDMETQGMGVNSVYVQEQIKFFNKSVLAREVGIESLVGKPVGKTKECFNPHSNPQIKEFFTNAGFSREKYDEEELTTIEHPLAKELLGLRHDSKIAKTYFAALGKGTVDGVFHPSIRQHGTVTGRTSSGGAREDG